MGPESPPQPARGAAVAPPPPRRSSAASRRYCAEVEGAVLDAIAIGVGVHVRERLHQLVLLDAMELDAVAGAEQQRVVAEGGVALADVVDRQRPAEQLVAARRLDRVDRDTRAADADRALGRPRPRGVVLGHEDRLARVEREHERQPGEEADERRPLLAGEDRRVELLAVGEAVVADDVVDVRAALGVRGVLANRADVALDGVPRGRVVERERHVHEPARDRHPLARSAASRARRGGARRAPPVGSTAGSYMTRIERKPGAVSIIPSGGSLRAARR